MEGNKFSLKFHPMFFLNYRYFLVGIIACPDEKTSFIHVLIHKHNCYIPGIVLGTRDTKINKIQTLASKSMRSSREDWQINFKSHDISHDLAH